ncbi:MAG: acyl-CoA transferase [Ancylobacter novellus]|uniref:Acyl-CoA transferase n=1 Tax=Ancylobacter novellus TaxID=921 RepID=A0A2W5ST38_ANCNO|nr:MAG: acyl-CoA transferase [Ancylobacter novellus]
MSVRETALAALHAALRGGLTGADVKRNSEVPEAVGIGGLVILRDGEAGEPEVCFSPPLYSFEHRASIEVYADGKTAEARSALLDSLLMQIGEVIEASPTLGGAAEYCSPGGPQVDALFSSAGGGLRNALVSVLLIYSTPSPLG